MKVLILGGHGYLGPHVVKALEPYYELRITDIKPIETKHEAMQVDASSLDDVMRAAEGMEAIINCSVLRHDRQIEYRMTMRHRQNDVVTRLPAPAVIELVVGTEPIQAS